MEYLLQHLLINAAKGFPDKEAVVFKDERISYRELDRLTDKLAATLRENGVGSGTGDRATDRLLEESLLIHQ